MDWQPIETAPDMERVIVAGWQKPHGTVRGYWWMHEDDMVDGKPFDHPDALFWHPMPDLSSLPAGGPESLRSSGARP